MLAAVGLFWIGSLGREAPVALVLVAATIFGLGKAYFWPTMLGVTSQLFPKGGAWLLALLGGAGNLSIAFVLPFMGSAFDRLGPGAALRSVAILPVVLVFVFGLLALTVGGTNEWPRRSSMSR